MKFTVELSDEDFQALQAMAVREYRDVKQQAGWLIRCALYEGREAEAKRRAAQALLDEQDREVMEEVGQMYDLPSMADDPARLARARENLERAARFAGRSGPSSGPSIVRERVQAQQYIKAAQAALDDDGTNSC